MNETQRNILTQYLWSEIKDIIDSGVDKPHDIGRVIRARLENRPDLKTDIESLLETSFFFAYRDNEGSSHTIALIDTFGWIRDLIQNE